MRRDESAHVLQYTAPIILLTKYVHRQRMGDIYTYMYDIVLGNWHRTSYSVMSGIDVFFAPGPLSTLYLRVYRDADNDDGYARTNSIITFRPPNNVS